VIERQRLNLRAGVLAAIDEAEQSAMLQPIRTASSPRVKNSLGPPVLLDIHPPQNL
jgi:hypothetical protein